MRHSQSIFPAAATTAGLARRDDEPSRRLPSLLYRRFPNLQVVPHRATAAILRFFIQLYRLVFSPAQIFLFGGGSGCRFTPTCSQYAAEAISRHGALAGSVLAFKRICRCHPLGGCGHDPVPAGGVATGQRQEGEAQLISNG
ncbi:MAG TPA: membrane protein insertion efficiency factor YidD [Verrucomicrobiae bacterium]